MTTTYQYGFIGAGNMAKGIIDGMLSAGIDANQIIASTKTTASSQKLRDNLGIHTTQNNNDCLAANIIILAVKPQILTAVLEELDSTQLNHQIIVSVIAGVPCRVYLKHLGNHVKLVRTMPNMPARIGEGMTGLYAVNCEVNDKAAAEQLMRYSGQTMWVQSETGIDYITAISGSGPAYVYAFINYLAKSGEKLGLTYTDALKLSLQTVMGAAKLAKQQHNGTPESMQALIDQITSKGGTTFAAMKSFEKDDFALIIDHAVQQCYRRAVELGETPLD